MPASDHPRLPILLTAITLLLSAVACDSSTQATPTPETNIEGVTWHRQLADPAPGRTPTARFLNGTLSGSGGCNTYFGSYRLHDGTVEVSELVMTAMACYNADGTIWQDRVPATGTHRIEVRGESPNRTLLLHGPESSVEYRQASRPESAS